MTIRTPHLLALCALLASCGAADDSSEPASKLVEPLEFGYRLFDSSSQCDFPSLGFTIHCCPGNIPTRARWAMLGAHLDNNVFKCAEIMPPVYAPPIVDGPD